MTALKEKFDYLKIKLASPFRILRWSNRRLPNGQFIGEIQKFSSDQNYEVEVNLIEKYNAFSKTFSPTSNINDISF